jgi:hypothetical protein
VRAKRTKQGILVLLGLLLVYIWSGNLKLFYGHGNDASYIEPNRRPVLGHSPQKTTLAYRAPRVNPFLRHHNPPKSQANALRSSAPAPPAELLHATHRLNGIVPKGKTSQAIILAPGNRSAVLEIGDSLGTWRLTTVTELFATFKQGKRCDTLWLVPPSK